MNLNGPQNKTHIVYNKVLLQNIYNILNSSQEINEDAK